VGKTAAAVNLASQAAASGKRVLLWDLDPQGAASWYLGAERDEGPRAKRLIKGKTPIGRAARPTAYERLDLVPGDFSFRHWDNQLKQAKDSKKIIKDLIEPFSESYHLVILDCPPGIGALAAAVLRAADRILIPTVPTPLSLRAVEQIRAFAEDEGVPQKRLQPFYSLVDRRKRLHKDLLANPPETMAPALPAWIGTSATVERMGEARAPLGAFAPRSPALVQFYDLWRALRERDKL